MALTEGQKALGWVEGTPAEFLGATPAQVAIAQIKIALADKLKATRLSQKLTQAQLAKRLKIQQPNVARMELGAERMVTMDILTHALLDLGVSGEEIAAVIAAAVQVEV